MRKDYEKKIRSHLKGLSNISNIEYVELKFFKTIFIFPKKPSLGAKSLNKIKPYGFLKSILWEIISFIYRTNISLLKNLFKDTKRKFDYLFCAAINDQNESKKIIIFHINKNTFIPDLLSKIPIDNYTKKLLDQECMILSLLKKNKLMCSPNIHYIKGIYYHEFIENKYSSTQFNNEHVRFLIKLLKKDKIQTKNIKKLFFKKINKIKFNVSTKILFKNILKNIPDDILIPKSMSHGDFCPWNIMENKEKKLIAIDWEYSDNSSLPFEDLLNFFLKKKMLIDNGEILDTLDWQNIYSSKSFNLYLRNIIDNEIYLKYIINLSLISLCIYWNSTKLGIKHAYGIYLIKNIKSQSFLKINNV